MQHRTIEDRLEEIETEVHDIKTMLLQYFTRKPDAAPENTEAVLMNVKDVAKFTGVEAAVIYSACAKGHIQFIKIGKLYKFKREEVMKWLNGEKKPGSYKETNVDEYVETYLQKNLLHG